MLISSALFLATLTGAAPALVSVPTGIAHVSFHPGAGAPDATTGLTTVDRPERTHSLPSGVFNRQAPPAVASSYSEGYQTRARIHRAASIATLPLFGTEALVGQSLFNNPSSGKRDASGTSSRRGTIRTAETGDSRMGS